MKTLMSLFTAVLFLAAVSNSAFAQTDETSTTCDGTGIQLHQNDGSGAGLQGAGNGVMSQLKENGGDFQAAFRATLTEEQLAIIENMELTREEKREALQATFSEAQQELYSSHMAEVAERQAQRGSNALSQSQAESAAKNGWQKGRN